MESGSSKASIIYFLPHEKPRYAALSGSVHIGYDTAERQTASPDHYLALPYPHLQKDQGTLLFEQNQWFYQNNSHALTGAGGHVLHFGDIQSLAMHPVIRIAYPASADTDDKLQDTYLTLLLLPYIPAGLTWETIELDAGCMHTMRITDSDDLHKPEEQQDYLDLHYDGIQWSITMLHSDKVFINAEAVHKPCSLHIDDLIQVDQTIFFFDGARLVYCCLAKNHAGLYIHIDERSVRTGLRKTVLLENIDLEIEPSQMVMILGGSGAGKSTFVNAVTGYEKANAHIEQGGIDVYRQYSLVRYRIGYVPQQDLMRGEDTVLATLMAAAKMRLPASYSDQQLRQKADEVLELFGLTPCINEQVCKLSGGQRKRLSISLEYISDPMLFFLDEPDSGLDGVIARQLMTSLRQISADGRIILVITHTPDRIIDLFDKIIVLAKSGDNNAGHLAFYGTPDEARNFFQVETMEEIVKLVSPQSEGGAGKASYFVQKFQQKYVPRKSPVTSEKDAESAGGYIGYFGQTRLYLEKLMRLFFLERNWKVIPMAAIMAFMVCYVVRSRMFQTMEGTKLGAFAFVCLCLWNGLFNSVLSVCRERNILKREHRAGLRISSYLSAHLLYQACVCFMQTVVTLLIFACMGMQFPDHGLVLTFSSILDLGITLFLVTFASDMIALMISCITRTTTTAMTIIPFILMIQVMLSGIIFPLGDILSTAANVTTAKWAMRAFSAQADYNALPSTSLYSALDKFRSEPLIEKTMDFLEENNGRELIEQRSSVYLYEPNYESTTTNVITCWLILMLQSGICVTVGAVSLSFIDRDQR